MNHLLNDLFCPLADVVFGLDVVCCVSPTGVFLHTIIVRRGEPFIWFLDRIMFSFHKAFASDVISGVLVTTGFCQPVGRAGIVGPLPPAVGSEQT